jgi:glucose/arabinose dehydrogenase
LRRSAALALLLAALLAVPAALARGVRHSAEFRPIATGLSGALYVAAPRGVAGTLYVVRQGGHIDAIVNGKVRATPFADVTARISSGGERGLLSMAFHPAYRTNHLVYLSFTDANGDSRIVRYRTDGAKILPATAKQLLFIKQPYPNHNGGQLEFGPDGKLYAGYGDGGSGGDPENRAQNTATKLGKLLRLDVSKSKARWQIVGIGLRNPWRFSFDRQNGDLWIGDVGQDTWEEVDVVPHAAVKPVLNFGWSAFEGNAKFKDEPLRGGALVKPAYVYHHGDAGCSITGGYVYRGAAVAALQGRYVFGDFCSGDVWSGVQSGGALTDVRSEGKIDELAGFGEDANGELYAASLGGTVYKLS